MVLIKEIAQALLWVGWKEGEGEREGGGGQLCAQGLPCWVEREAAGWDLRASSGRVSGGQS